MMLDVDTNVCLNAVLALKEVEKKEFQMEKFVCVFNIHLWILFYTIYLFFLEKFYFDCLMKWDI